MSQRVEVQLVDDLDPDTAADVTCTFALNGVQYEIDLTNANATRLEEALAPFIGAGRRVGGRKKKS